MALNATNPSLSEGATLRDTWTVAADVMNAVIAETCSEIPVTILVFLLVWLFGARVGIRTSATKKKALCKTMEKPQYNQYNRNVRRASTSNLSLRGAHVSTPSSRPAPPSRVDSVIREPTILDNEDGDSPALRRMNTSRLAREADSLASAVRAGNSDLLCGMIDESRLRIADGDGKECGEILTGKLFLAAIRACAGKRAFKDALVLYDHVKDLIGVACGSTWSLLLWSAVEAEDYLRCKAFIVRLRSSEVPSGIDFVNMVRFHIHNGDEAAFVEDICSFKQDGCNIDAVSRNKALSLIVASNSRAFASTLAKHVWDGGLAAMDVVAWNTILKGHALAGEYDKCLELYKLMRSNNVLPSEMTYGVLIDALVDAGDLRHASETFEDLKQSGLPVNVIHFTTIIKGLVNHGKLDDAIAILKEMRTSPGARPDLITYSTIMKAQAAVGEVAGAVELLQLMLEQGLQPDGIIHNIVLNGCCAKALPAAAIFQVFATLVEKGLQPTTTTTSILIKALSKSCAWREAVNVLEIIPGRFGLWPEARIYGQLAQGCAQAGRSEETIMCYALMIKAAAKCGTRVGRAINNRLNMLCHSCNEGERASIIHRTVEESDWMVSVQQVASLMAKLALREVSVDK